MVALSRREGEVAEARWVDPSLGKPEPGSARTSRIFTRGRVFEVGGALLVAGPAGVDVGDPRVTVTGECEARRGRATTIEMADANRKRTDLTHSFLSVYTPYSHWGKQGEEKGAPLVIIWLDLLAVAAGCVKGEKVGVAATHHLA